MSEHYTKRGSKFSALLGRWLDPIRFRVEQPFFYESSRGLIEVPAAFISDLDSVPRIPLVYWTTKNRTVYAAIVHDWLYAVGELNGKPITRREADAIFYEAMVDEGVRWWHRQKIWLGVRFGGWRRWNLARELKS